MPDSTLSSSVTLKDGALWLGKIELRGDKIVISGWTWSGPVEKEIPIRRLTTFETWWGGRNGSNFRLVLEDESHIEGRIENGHGLWEAKMEDAEHVDFNRRI